MWKVCGGNWCSRMVGVELSLLSYSYDGTTDTTLCICNKLNACSITLHDALAQII